jgi:hypothetical protein
MKRIQERLDKTHHEAVAHTRQAPSIQINGLSFKPRLR